MFRIYGPFDIPTKEGSSRHGIEREDGDKLWEDVDKHVDKRKKERKKEEGEKEEKRPLSLACGCYVFGLRNPNNEEEQPWYVGKAENQTFRKECFTRDKRDKYNEIMRMSGNRSNRVPIMYLVAKISRYDWFSDPAKRPAKHPDIRFAEKLLIGLARLRNSKLLNVRDTSWVDIEIRGLYNNPRGGSSKAAKGLREMFQVEQVLQKLFSPWRPKDS